MSRYILLGYCLLALIMPGMAQGDGGMHLEGFCTDEQQLVLTNYSGFGWRCMEPDGTLVDIDLVQVCEDQYDGERAYPFLTTLYNPFGWSCVSEVSTSMMMMIPEPPTRGGGLDLSPLCQYSPEMAGSRLEIVDDAEGTGQDYACISSTGETLPIDFEAACDWQYPYTEVVHVTANDTPWGHGCEETE